MSTVAIKVDNIGKRYRIGKEKPRPATIAGRLAQTLASPFDWLMTQLQKPDEKDTIWAVRDISFTINCGEVVGVIGCNGAGKSTLLKILSRITGPTEGYGEIHGRIGALLEIGTGMSPELTGRENIFVNGCVLGMSRREVLDKFDEIVDFSGIGKFIDTPVKRYSSGMQVRLGFAIAAHLEPEILVVDEVLAVGDAEFQEKCLGKMHNIAGHGRTVLFVSHNMQAIEQLCQRAILLENGQLVMDEPDPRKVVDAYLSRGLATEHSDAVWHNPNNQFANRWFTPRKMSICQADGQPARGPFRNNDDMLLRIEGEVEEVDRGTHIGFTVTDEREATIFVSAYTDETLDQWPRLKPGRNILQTQLPKRMLNEGRYKIHLDLRHRPSHRLIVDPKYGHVAVQFRIAGSLSESPVWRDKRPGLCAPILPWKNL